jgi:hypothetical protein
MTIRPASLVAAALLVLAGCGSAAAPAPPAASPAARTTRSAGPQGFQIPSVLQSSMRHQIDKKLRKVDPGTRVTSIQCVMEGRQRAECVADFSDGESTSDAVVISADGDGYVTK